MSLLRHLPYQQYSSWPQATISLSTRLAVAVLLPLLGIIFYRAFLHPLSGIPGPFLARLTGLWRTYRYFRMTWHEDILKLHETYGPVVRIAPNEISLVDSDAMKQLYSHGHSAKKTSWYNTWEAGVPSPVLFSETDSKLHASLRRRVSGAYSMTAILKYEKYMQSCLDLCWNKFERFAEDGTVVNMSEWTHALAFDIVGELNFGQKLGHLETGTDVDDLRKTNTSDIYWAGNFGHFWFQSWLFTNAVVDAFAALVGHERPGLRFQNWAFERVLRRKEGKDPVDREDMLSHFLRMKPLDGNDALDVVEVLVEAVNVIGAGADTTSIGMKSCLYFLCKNPDVYSRLQKEIDDFYEQNHLDQPITYMQTQQLPYLKAVISEATRLLPSIVYQLLREAPEGGLTVDGHYIPAGTPVGISPLAQNRDKKVWGKDAGVFRPDRWLESPAQTAYLESRNMTYGGNGPRACIGRNIALVELHKFVAQALRNFDLEIVDKKTPWKIKTYWFADQTEFYMRLRSRRPLVD